MPALEELSGAKSITVIDITVELVHADPGRVLTRQSGSGILRGEAGRGSKLPFSPCLSFKNEITSKVGDTISSDQLGTNQVLRSETGMPGWPTPGPAPASGMQGPSPLPAGTS